MAGAHAGAAGGLRARRPSRLRAARNPYRRESGAPRGLAAGTPRSFLLRAVNCTRERATGLGKSGARQHLERETRDLGIHGIAIDDELSAQRVSAFRQLVAEVETAACVRADRNSACEHDVPFVTGHHIGHSGAERFITSAPSL